VPNPWTLYVECEACGETTPHEVLKGQEREGRDAVIVEGIFKCKQCGKTGQRALRDEKPVVLQVILSAADGSRRSTVTVDAAEKLAVGDELFVGKDRIVVTALEAEGRHVEAAVARERPVVWSKIFNRVKVKVSINRGHSTAAELIDAAPDEEFSVGEILTIKRSKAVIHTIKTGTSTLRQGGASARAITRIYAREMRETFR
jgi:uncharacterized Zn finger protein